MTDGPTKREIRRPRGADGNWVKSPDTLERDLEAFDMRTQGRPYAEIALALGFSSASAACSAITRHVQRRIGPSIDEHRARMDEELDTMQRALLRVMETTHFKVADGRVVYFDGVDGNGPPKPLVDDSPIYAGIDRWLKIQERRAKLFGLDAPSKVETNGSVTVRVEGADDV